jgi:SAM-dependent methyltransferase
VDGKRVLDLGCGDGRLTFALARHAGFVVGLDRDEEAIRRASARSVEEGTANVRFAVADVEAVEYDAADWGGSPDVVTAHLCMSDAMIERAARALAPGFVFAGVALHANQWKETGVPSRFAYTEDSIAKCLAEAGFHLLHGRVEEEVLVFESSGEAERALLEGAHRAGALNARRVEGLRKSLSGGGKEITRKSHLLFLARKGE